MIISANNFIYFKASIYNVFSLSFFSSPKIIPLHFDLELKSAFFPIQLLPSESIINTGLGKWDWEVIIQVVFLEKKKKLQNESIEKTFSSPIWKIMPLKQRTFSTLKENDWYSLSYTHMHKKVRYSSTFWNILKKHYVSFPIAFF